MIDDEAGPVLRLVKDLVAAPSRGGLDSYGPVIGVVEGWLREHGLDPRVLRDGAGAEVAVVCEVVGRRPGPRLVLDACLDTAPFGDESAWSSPPAIPVERDGWLYGRGTADSKTAVAVFCHIAARVLEGRDRLAGTLVLLFDLDEHTGGFGGAKAYFESAEKPAGVIIGYPGIDTLVVGGRGVHRVRLHVHGVASHSGGRAATPNAIVKAAGLVAALSATKALDGTGAKLTVTEIGGGQGFSVTPDRCSVGVDVRTTADFGDDDAHRLLEAVAHAVDRDWPGTRPTTLEAVTSWPPYALAEGHPLPAAIRTAATRHGLALRTKVAGPSNIGNYLAGLGIPATAGFGVDYRGLHGTDERIRVDAIPVVLAVYLDAVRALLSAPPECP
ncbi:succinyl-diaminopimelate desuccinylase [Actinoplanes tereljensis]|uniref:Carboxypeptidase n=1 Tax=Paractinoplanes tereljensis TaxID=571912 RepID=A0A919NLU7_9ACTN|nr:M20 family metallopeptidase [Actinoplanes tereljensis]GIF20505.1 carboxypeptidase [Actinoplanes tereljensis]